MSTDFAVISRQSQQACIGLSKVDHGYENTLTGQQEGANPLIVPLDANNIPTHNPSVYLVAAENSMAALHYPSRTLLLPALRVVKTTGWKIWRSLDIGV